MKFNARLISVAAAMFLSVMAFGVFASIVPSDELPPRLGEWNAHFAEVKAMAERDGIPMVSFWGATGCDTCSSVELALQQDEVKRWQAERKLLMVFQKDEPGPMKDFTINASGVRPYICVYWVKGDGTAITNRFSGTTRGDSRWPVTGKSIAEHFILSVESCIEGYEPSENYSGEFKVGNTVSNRLEAVVGVTEKVSVPLVRVRASVPFASTNTVVVSFPVNTLLPSQTTRIEWTAGQDEAAFDVVIPQDASLSPGDMITLTLHDSAGARVDTSSIAVVADPGKTIKNPGWIGEGFEFGEWTMDLDAATNKVAAAAGDAYTLVYFTGVLWCPWCKGLEAGVIAKPEFTAWARDNQVALVVMDNPHRSADAQPLEPNGAPPTLLRYEADANGVSGASYLSRKTIWSDSAEAVLRRNHALGYPGGFFCAPESVRTGYPSFILLRKDGRLVGRFVPWRTDDKVYDTQENMARLGDWLKLAGRDGESSDYRTTTALRLSLGAGARSVFQVSRRSEFFALDGVMAGRIEFRRSDGGTEPVYFQLMQGAETVSPVGTNGLDVTISAAAARKGNFFLKISAYPNATYDKYFASGARAGVETTEFAATFESSAVLLPEDSRISFAPMVSELKMEVSAGAAYRLSGFTSDSLASAFDFDESRDAYVAKAGGLATLAVAAVGQAVSYQSWNPGEFAFASGSFEVGEKSGRTAIEVVRTNGYSGAASVRVRVDSQLVAPGRCRVGVMENGVFVEKEPTFEWDEGETGAKAFVLDVVDDIVYDGDQLLFLSLETIAGETPVSDEAGVIAVTLLEDDEPIPGTLAVTATDPVIARNATVYAATGSVVTVEVSRLVGSEGEAKATFTATIGGEDCTDRLMEKSELVWEDGRTRRSPDAQTVTLVVPEDLGTEGLVLTLTASGAKLDRSSRSLTVRAVDLTAPVFADGASVEIAARRNVMVSRELPLTGVTGEGRVTIRKLSGSLPAGVSAAYSAKRGAMVVSGVPARGGRGRAGEKVNEERESGAVAGLATEITVVVDEIADSFPVLKQSKARTFADIPFVADAYQRLVGMMTLTVPANGKASAKYVCAGGTVSMAATGWTDASDGSGDLMALLVPVKQAFIKYYAELFLRRDGTLRVEVYDPDYSTDMLTAVVGDCEPWSSANRADRWQGRYTVAMPAKRFVALNDADGSYAVSSSGTPTLALRMNTVSDRAAGRLFWAGTLANGQSVSGSSRLRASADGKTAQLPILSKQVRDFFTALLEVKADAAKAYEGEQHEHRAISAVPGVLPWWRHDEKVEMGVFGWTYDVYGAYFDPKEDLSACLVRLDVASNMVFSVDAAMVEESPYRGIPGEVTGASLTVTGRRLDGTGVRVSYSAGTGVVSGSFTFPFSKKDVRAAWRGVVMPGWPGCGCDEEKIDQPFVMGACWFSDTFTYRESETDERLRTLTVKRGCAVRTETRMLDEVVVTEE